MWRVCVCACVRVCVRCARWWGQLVGEGGGGGQEKRLIMSTGPAPPGQTQQAQDNIRTAVEKLHATRIGHGVAAKESEAVRSLLAARNVAVEICPTSNVHTGAIGRVAEHPCRDLLAAGITVVPCCDNSLLSQTTTHNQPRTTSAPCWPVLSLPVACPGFQRPARPRACVCVCVFLWGGGGGGGHCAAADRRFAWRSLRRRPASAA